MSGTRGPSSSALKPPSGPGRGGRPRRSIAKAISWRMVGTLDTLLLSWAIITFLGPWFGLDGEASHAENLGTASYIAVTEVVTKIVLYYLHERGWERIEWGAPADETGRRRDARRRSAVKTGSWRAIASLDTFLLALLFTGSAATAASIGGFEVITKLCLYFLHERVWSRIGFGAR